MVKQVRLLRFIGISEGVSFLVLLLIAMPLKYYFGLPIAVKFVGAAHGGLFIAYIAIVLASIKVMKWGWFQVLVELAASFIPFGTFFLDKGWRRREAELIEERK
ncbi:DUF3817 domain-containing protein [soil metagenome]